MSETLHDSTKSTHCRDVGALSSHPAGKECNVITKRIPIVLGHFVNRTVLHITRGIKMINHIYSCQIIAANGVVLRVWISVSNYSELLEKCGSQGVKLMILRCMAIEVYKCVNNMNPQYLNEMFILKKCPYDLRDNSLLERPAARLTNYGLKSFKSYGAKIWNLLPATYKMGVSFDTFKNMIKTWSGPTCKCSVCCLFTTWLSNHIHV